MGVIQKSSWGQWSLLILGAWKWTPLPPCKLPMEKPLNKMVLKARVKLGDLYIRFGFVIRNVSFKFHDSIRDSDSAALVLWFGFVIRIRSIRIYDSDSWFGFAHVEFMIRIRDSDSVIQNLWFGFVIRRIITNHESYDSRIIWFVDHW